MNSPSAAVAGADSRLVHPKYSTDRRFQAALNARLDRYFRFTRQTPRDHPGMYLKTFIILTWFVGSYLALVFWAAAAWQAVALAISLGFAMAAVGFNIQHDGGHGAYSQSPRINRLTALSMDLIGGSSYVWAHKHNTLHHTYANIAGEDDDIDVGILGRFAPQQPWRWWHRAQHWYIWLLYAGLAIKWHLYDDFRDVLRGRVGAHRFARPTGWSLVAFLGGKALTFTLAFVLPSLFHPFGLVVLFYALASGVQGVCLSIVFQLAHVVEGAAFPTPAPGTGQIERSWAAHQVDATADFAQGNRLLSWLVGGLNFQIEHHLFPRVCHIHYPRIAALVRRVCRKFEIPYRTHPTVRAGLVAHFRWLREMARPPHVAAI